MNPSNPPAPLRLVVLASGRGSNLQAIAACIDAATLPAEIAAVVSDRTEAGAVAWARRRGVAVEVLSPREFPDRTAYGKALAARIDPHAPGLVVLAGFMRILSDEFVDQYAGRLFNIHPSLLPKYPGLHTHRRVLEAGDREHGASVHFVTAELDGGPVILQARVPVLPGDDEATLAARLLPEEHRIYPTCIDWFARGRLALRGGAVWLDGRQLEAPVLHDDVLRATSVTT